MLDSLTETRSSIFQHALILTIKPILNEIENSDQIQPYAQDLAYTGTDISLLRKTGITVLDGPKGFLEADGSTFVLSFAAGAPARQNVSDLTQPTAMILDRVWEDEDQLPSILKDGKFSDPSSPSLRDMIKILTKRLSFLPKTRCLGTLLFMFER